MRRQVEVSIHISSWQATFFAPSRAALNRLRSPRKRVYWGLSQLYCGNRPGVCPAAGPMFVSLIFNLCSVRLLNPASYEGCDR